MKEKNIKSYYEKNNNLNNLNNLNDIIIPTKNSSLSQKLHPLINGLNIYKRFDNVNYTLLHRKNFNPLKFSNVDFIVSFTLIILFFFFG